MVVNYKVVKTQALTMVQVVVVATTVEVVEVIRVVPLTKWEVVEVALVTNTHH